MPFWCSHLRVPFAAVSTVPKSRTNPQFNKDALPGVLASQHGIEYLWMGKELGGLRSRDKSSDMNAGWDNDSFRGNPQFCWLGVGAGRRGGHGAWGRKSGPEYQHVCGV